MKKDRRKNNVCANLVYRLLPSELVMGIALTLGTEWFAEQNFYFFLASLSELNVLRYGINRYGSRLHCPMFDRAFASLVGRSIVECDSCGVHRKFRVRKPAESFIKDELTKIGILPSHKRTLKSLVEKLKKARADDKRSHRLLKYM